MHYPLVLTTFTTPFGPLEVLHDNQFIFHSIFISTANQKPNTQTDNTLVHRINSELHLYLTRPHHPLQLPLKLQGSTFQLKVWNALLAITPGHPITYGDLALALNSAPRAIGQACKRNPIALFIPCHRVVGKNSLGGYMGAVDALPIKSALLAHEARH